MISTILTSSFLYWTTALDLLLILALLYNKFDEEKHSVITYGQITGSLILLSSSLLLAYVFHFVPESWILGFLGLIPLGFGLKYLIAGDDDEEEVEEQLEKRRNKSLFVTVTLISFASCGADNIGLFTPYFVNMRTNVIPLSILTFLANIALLGVLGHKLSHQQILHNFLEKYSRWIIATVYIALGLFIFLEAGSLAKILSLF